MFALARRLYLPLLGFALRRRVVVVAAALLALVAAAALVPRLGTEFLPVMDEGAFDMDVQLIPGVSLEKAMETAGDVEERLKRFPELETVVSRTGQTGVAIEARGVDKTGFVGALKPREQWTSARSREELIEKMRDALADIPGMAFTFSQPIQCRIDELVAGTRAQLIVKLFGDDTDVLRRKAGEMAVDPGRDPRRRRSRRRARGRPALPDRDRRSGQGRPLRRNTGDVLSVIELAIGGKPLSPCTSRTARSTLRSGSPRNGGSRSRRSGGLLIDVPGGYRVPLNQLAELKTVEGPTQISRENGQRRIGIEMNVVGRDIGELRQGGAGPHRADASICRPATT